MKPPIGGPSTGPAMPGTSSQAIAETSSSRGTGAQQDEAGDRDHQRTADALDDAGKPPETPGFRRHCT